MIVFQETSYYETRELAFIFSAMVVCCIGIYFLYAKTKNMKQIESALIRSTSQPKISTIAANDDDYMLETRSQVMRSGQDA